MATSAAAADVPEEQPTPGLEVQEELTNLRRMINDLMEQLTDVNETMTITRLEVEQLREGKVQADKNVADLKELIAKINAKGKDYNDMKDLIKASIFSGKDEDFHDWQSDMEDAITAKNRKLRSILLWAKEEQAEIETAKAITKMKNDGIEDAEEVLDKLFMMIKGHVTGEAKMICESAEDEHARNGLEAWRLLRDRFNPHTPQSENDLQNAILRPDRVTKLSDLMPAIESWEEKQRRLTRLNGDTQSEAQKKHIVGTICPHDLQHHLNMKGAEMRTYRDVRKEIVRYVDSMRTGVNKKSLGSLSSGLDVDQSESETNREELQQQQQDTDINAMTKAGYKGSGKGLGGTKGTPAPQQQQQAGKTFSGQCWNCQGNHPMFLCPQLKGKGKGGKGDTKGGPKGAGSKGKGKGSWQWGAPQWGQGKPAWGG